MRNLTFGNQYSIEALYDGGWRSEDKEELISEYELTEGEAEEICEGLKELREELLKSLAPIAKEDGLEDKADYCKAFPELNAEEIQVVMDEKKRVEENLCHNRDLLEETMSEFWVGREIFKRGRRIKLLL